MIIIGERFIRRLCKTVATLVLLLIIFGLCRHSFHVDPDETADPQTPAAGDVAPKNNSASIPPENPLANVPTDETWRRAIDNILRNNADIADRSGRMLQLLPNLPPAMQTEAAQHLVNFATDEAPQTIVQPLLEKKADPAAQGVLLLALLQRADNVRLPILLQIARDPEHPKRTNALQYLEFVLEQKHGSEWSAWEQAIAQRLKATQL